MRTPDEIGTAYNTLLWSMEELTCADPKEKKDKERILANKIQLSVLAWVLLDRPTDNEAAMEFDKYVAACRAAKFHFEDSLKG